MKKTAQKTRPETAKRNILALTDDDLKTAVGGVGVIVQADGK